MIVSAVALAYGVSGMAAVDAQAQDGLDLPCNSVQLIVPWGAGGDTDIIFRQVVEKANELGADPELRVVNVGGQGGNRGAAEVLDADADGCTLLALHDSAITSYLTERVDFNWDEFDTISLLTYTPSVVGAALGTPYDDMSGMIEHAEANPGEISAGSTIGSTSHFIFLMIEDEAGVEFNHVPFDGTRERLTGMLAGTVDLGEMNIITANQYIEDEELKALGIALPERDPTAPDIPTLAEQGYDVEYGLSRGVVAPPGTDAEIISYYEDLFGEAMEAPEVAEALEGAGTSVRYMNAEDYAAFMEDNYELHERIAIAIGLYNPEG
ncbi:tripartite tricarboxylate transporter substrate binding protein [Fodinicurvata sp. EGI_FJ10296]|uniref:Bug family tripartite tricarboxylate transporter substrate binding protein n=1 Tax=Fodinicurvata sp. EGI_FJ10296 TaxID=3231908 RepID=UPI003455DC4A